jgi:NAD(P)-dependent dehydrogenase (short-subunit alcohol dehydrogenase family)
MIHLHGHSALVTGSTKGVGRAIAVAMAQAGADVLIHGRQRSNEADQVVQQCRQLGRQAEFVAADLFEPTVPVVDRLVGDALRLMPRLSILVNNAGSYFDQPFLEMDYETFDRTMRLNVYSAFFLTQRLARHWIQQGIEGRVLMIGSINGRLAEPDHTAYDTSKGAVEMMVKSLCVALAPQGIRVNGLAPGLVRTPLTAIIDQDPQFERWMCLHTPNGQVPSADVCGDAAVYLVSDSAWHVHGQMLLVDGGMSAWQQPNMPRSTDAGSAS